MSKKNWNYQEAFSRNLGLISPTEQERIKNFRIAIGGMGGVGGVHLLTLARMGFSRFHIADFDTFEIGNFNRQVGATLGTIGQNKSEAMTQIVRQINPDAEIVTFTTPLCEKNIPDFMKDCHLYVDGIDAFEIRVRRDLFNRARQQGIYSLTAGPLGLSTAWLSFAPKGMSFDEYIGYQATDSDFDLFVKFIASLSPRFLHLPYMDTSYVDSSLKRGPSNMLACQLCSGVVAAEVLKIALDRGRIYSAPYFQQFDPYRNKYVRGRLFGGAKDPRVLIIKSILRRKFKIKNTATR